MFAYYFFERRGRGAMARAPDCLAASHVCVPVSNPAVTVWGFQFSILNVTTGDDHVNSGLVELRLRSVYRR